MNFEDVDDYVARKKVVREEIHTATGKWPTRGQLVTAMAKANDCNERTIQRWDKRARTQELWARGQAAAAAAAEQSEIADAVEIRTRAVS